MAYSSTKVGQNFPLGGGYYGAIYTATDVSTGGTDTIATSFRKILQVSPQNKTRAAAGGLKVAVSGGTITLTAETANDDFELLVVGTQ